MLAEEGAEEADDEAEDGERPMASTDAARPASNSAWAGSKIVVVDS